METIQKSSKFYRKYSIVSRDLKVDWGIRLELKSKFWHTGPNFKLLSVKYSINVMVQTTVSSVIDTLRVKVFDYSSIEGLGC